MKNNTGVFEKIIALCSQKEKKNFYGLLALFVVSGLIDSAGISSIMPFLLVLTNPVSIQSSPIIIGLFSLLGQPEQKYFLLILGGGATLLLVLSNAMAALTATVMFRFTFRQGASMSSRLLSKYLYQPYPFFLHRNTKDLTRNVYDEVGLVVRTQKPENKIGTKSLSRIHSIRQLKRLPMRVPVIWVSIK